MTDTLKATVPLEVVLKTEQDQIEKVREKRDKGFNRGVPRAQTAAPAAPIPGRTPTDAERPGWQTTGKDWVNVIEHAHQANLVGLAFSGGGIRSATFSLGVLQALADLKLLYRVDYLSTVSGGGYIGGWLAAWTKRLKSFAKVQEQLSTHRVNLKDDKEQTPVRFLRMFSNYLTPKLGIFSGDTWAMIAIYLRNLLLNQAVVLALVATLLLTPRVIQRLTLDALSAHGIGYVLMSAEVALLLIAFLMILINMGYLDSRHMKDAPKLTEQNRILLVVCAPLFVAAAVAALWLAVRFEWRTDHQPIPYGKAALIGAITYCVIWALASWGERVYGKRISGWVTGMVGRITNPGGVPLTEKTGDQGATADAEVRTTRSSQFPLQPVEVAISTIAALGSGALAGWLIALLSSQELCRDETKALTMGVPLVVGVFLLAGMLHIGLMGVVFRDWKREWWGRLGGWLLVFGITWLMLFWLALLFPGFIRDHAALWSGWKALVAKSLTPAWILSTIGTVLAGNSKASGEPGAKTWLDTAIQVGPYVFMAGLLCWVSWGIDCLLTYHKGWLYPALLVCAVVALVMAWRVDINQFSMHMFYRNRLVSCYLGASHKNRSPNRFTGFDPDDDMALKSLGWKGPGHPVHYDGPYPVFNASLNLVKGKDLAWQERKAESFVMTPHFCGYDVWLEEQDSPMLMRDRPLTEGTLEKSKRDEALGIFPELLPKLERFGYCPTEEYAFPHPFHGPNLGLAMAISGAAASPNMGFYSSTPVAFLMTVFNVRLGQWLGNPRNRRTSRRASPGLGLWCLVNELLGGTNDEAAYVYLSDGGHFDNMGLYELVKRRCGLIIVCDAEADEHYGFSGLGNAIRRCRIDLGIDIDLNTSEIAPKEAGGLSTEHCAVGTIHYEYADRAAPTGTIVYFKASLIGDESADVKNYKKGHASFPHEPTIDQWFSESQFESYRQLGYQAVFNSIKGMPPATPKPMEQKLHGIFKDFGFEIQDLPRAAVTC